MTGPSVDASREAFATLRVNVADRPLPWYMKSLGIVSARRPRSPLVLQLTREDPCHISNVVFSLIRLTCTERLLGAERKTSIPGVRSSSTHNASTLRTLGPFVDDWGPGHLSVRHDSMPRAPPSNRRRTRLDASKDGDKCTYLQVLRSRNELPKKPKRDRIENSE